MRWPAFALLLALLVASPWRRRRKNEGPRPRSATRHHPGDSVVPLEQPTVTTPSVTDPSDRTERITSFDSDITVAKNGTLTVAETIAVYATHGLIQVTASIATSRRPAPRQARPATVKVRF